MAGSFDYDVFVSYSRNQLDRDVTVRLQAELQRFTRPWYRPRARTLRVFRDQTNLPASPDLWGTIKDAMSSSQWLLLVASPRSAQSTAVRREIEWWRARRGSANFCIALADGELRWDEAKNDLDWSVTTALSRDVLERAFDTEPAWVDVRPTVQADSAGRRGRLRRLTRPLADPRLQDAIASLIAEIRNVPKDTLIGEHLRRSRQIRLAVTATLLVLTLLLAASITAAFIATSQRDRAIRQATISESGQLAAIADSLTGSHLDLAELFAAEAYKLYPDPQTRAALFKAVTADPHLVRYLQATGTVSAMASSADARTAVAGTTRGDVLRWSLTDFKRTVVGRLPAAVSSVAVSADGATIAAVGGSTAEIWVRGRAARSVPVPANWVTVAAAVSPSGQYVAFSVHGHSFNSPYYVVLIDERTGRPAMARLDRYNGGSDMSFSGETQLVAFDSGSGWWERFAIPSLVRVSGSSGQFGAHVYAAALSPGGDFMSFTNAGAQLPVWTTLSSPTPAFAPPLGAHEAGDVPDALAISADGRRAADASSGTIYVSNITAYRNAGSGSLLPLAGNETVNANGLMFVGDSDSELLSSSNNLITMWNVGQYSRIAAGASVDIPGSCNGCAGPGVYVSSKGNYAVITANNNLTAMVVSLPPSAKRPRLLPQNSGTEYGPAVWSQNGQEFTILTPSDRSGEVWSVARNLALLGGWARGAAPGQFDSVNDFPSSMTLAGDGTQAAEVDTNGNVVLRNFETGSVEHTVPGPMGRTSADAYYPNETAADQQARYAAVIVEVPWRIPAYVINIRSGAVTALPGGPASGVAYYGELLLVQRPGGTLEVRSADGRRLIRSFAGDANAVDGPVVGSSGLAVEVNPDGTAPVFDVASGQEIGSITLPPGWRPAATTIGFNPRGQDLVSATEGLGTSSDVGQVTEWSFSSRRWSDVACASAGHRLTSKDWYAYVGTGGPGMPSDMACGS
jgi:WD40 repeat protein